MTSPNRSPNPAESLFWDLIDELRGHDERVEEGTIMGGRCARVSGEFLGLVDYKCSGMVVKLPRDRVDELIAQGIGQPFAPAGKVFREWVAITKPDRRRWSKLLVEAVCVRCTAERRAQRAFEAMGPTNHRFGLRLTFLKSRQRENSAIASPLEQACALLD